MQPISSCSALRDAMNFLARAVPTSKCWVKMFIMPIICSTLKLNKPIPPNALCKVLYSFFTLRFTPRNAKSLKFCCFKTPVATKRGVASATRPYLTPAHNLKQYTIRPIFAGRCPFLILSIHFSTQSITLCLTCASSLPSILDQMSSAFSATNTSPCEIFCSGTIW